MRAIILRAFGAPDVLEVAEVERPEPAAGEVLVRVEAVGLNPVEAFARSGSLPLFGPPPMVLGWDVAGVVEAVGYGVTRFAVGDRATDEDQVRRGRPARRVVQTTFRFGTTDRTTQALPMPEEGLEPPTRGL
jgi:NADPH:quinone reductase-like Zn-dependent oxidoreductase